MSYRENLILANAVRRYHLGDGLTDEELNTYLKFQKDLVDKLDFLGVQYRIQWKHEHRILGDLEIYKENRKKS